MSLVSLGAFAAIRMIVGTSALVTPHLAAPLFGMPLPAETTLIARLYGVRDLALGGLLWTSLPPKSTSLSPQQQEPTIITSIAERKAFLRRVLWTTLAVDALDFVSCAVGLLEGNIEMKAVFCVGGAALLGVAWSGVALQSLRGR